MHTYNRRSLHLDLCKTRNVYNSPLIVLTCINIQDTVVKKHNVSECSTAYEQECTKVPGPPTVITRKELRCTCNICTCNSCTCSVQITKNCIFSHFTCNSCTCSVQIIKKCTFSHYNCNNCTCSVQIIKNCTLSHFICNSCTCKSCTFPLQIIKNRA